MNNRFVKLAFDVKRCDGRGYQPSYRIYFDDELFSERTWYYTDQYLREMLQINAPPGHYSIKIMTVAPSSSVFKISNFEIVQGPARCNEKGQLEIIE